jgi:hypothetical protein
MRYGPWFVFCVLMGLGMLGVLVWAVLTIVAHFAGAPS